MRLREQLLQQLGDHLRHLHRAVDRDFTLRAYGAGRTRHHDSVALSHAAAFRRVSVNTGQAVYDSSHHVGDDLARTLIEAAKQSVRLTTAKPINSRSLTPAKISPCSAVGCGGSRKTSNSAWRNTRSASC